MLRLDGDAGGGQLVRTALSLSLVTGESFEMENIRGNRSTPGLKAQHVACVSVAESVANADVDGGSEGSSTLQFDPESVTSDPVSVSVGTAGSTTLVSETLLPVAVAIDDPLTLTVTGGTDVRWSPPADYLRYVKRPLCSAFGVSFDVDVLRRGFYPAGGGRLAVRIDPAKPTPVDLLGRPPLDGIDVYSVASEALADASVADRQVEGVRTALAAEGVETPVRASVAYDESTSPGTAVVLAARCGDVVAGFDAYGERGVRAEEVGAQAVDAFADWYRTDAPVDRHMADQLLVWVALAGGRVRIPAVTEHVRTNLDVIRAFGYDIDVRETDGGAVVERVE
ncbi:MULTISPECIES: RNA 3'-terminal phosphate cyclase [Haloferax]|uniref:RNA 3'-terminal phosphate cyclase n=1 Tax=Haloferax marinum TaxID=2666143 RepID=A0A6A8G5Q0_9EURY|nr:MULTISPECIES: RNA 3'-terminal phosphate cyclase [Haloferax]KAB1197336.1 RNA 3'-terminal phosphate cyclase [Haloferax sp. CBA1150]MRW96379.1 RNA 3'-terminal phosphate cyclase [Haloferax marinum]